MVEKVKKDRNGDWKNYSFEYLAQSNESQKRATSDEKKTMKAAIARNMKKNSLQKE